MAEMIVKKVYADGKTSIVDHARTAKLIAALLVGMAKGTQVAESVFEDSAFLKAATNNDGATYIVTDAEGNEYRMKKSDVKIALEKGKAILALRSKRDAVQKQYAEVQTAYKNAANEFSKLVSASKPAFKPKGEKSVKAGENETYSQA